MPQSRHGTAITKTSKRRQKYEPRKPVTHDVRQLAAFRTRLLGWYDANKRDLPWRVTKDPFAIWLSEIMLQQTRIAVVKEYYGRFLRRFPSVEVLAKARISSVLAAWSGLGYYRRARALRAAARKVVGELGGEIPSSAKELQTLPGIGRYTSAAIASIAFGQPEPVVDGNVERVITRLWARNFENRATWDAAAELLDRARPGDFNQAMMELGATVCVPGQPLCEGCPVRRWCLARGQFGERVAEPRKRATLRFSLATRDGSVFLVRRPADSSLMAEMWELPEITADFKFQSNGHGGFKLRHAITVTDFSVEVLPGDPPVGAAGKWVLQSRVAALPLTGLTRKIFRRAGII
jgi:A/G-specific adenine glycosylase